MRRPLMPACVLAAALAGLAAERGAGDSALQRIEVPGEGGAVLLQVPDGWVGKTKELSSSQTSIEFGPVSGDAARFNVTLLIEKPPEEQTGEGEKGPSSRLPEMREKLERTRDDLLPQSTPPSRKQDGVPAVLEFQGDSVIGYYFSFSGKRSKPDKYRYLAIGSALLDKIPIQFIVSSNASPKDQVAAALAMLKSAKWEPPDDEEHARLPGGGTPLRGSGHPDEICNPNERNLSSRTGVTIRGDPMARIVKRDDRRCGVRKGSEP